MPRIEIGAGIVLSVAAGLNAFGDVPVAVVLLVFGILLILYGSYEEWVKPHFRVDQRLNDWLQRRGWSVRIERVPQFNFVLHITAPDSGKEIIVTRDKTARNDVLAFTTGVGLHPQWTAPLIAMSAKEREGLKADIGIYVTAKNLGIHFGQLPDGRLAWPPSAFIQTALAQDRTLSQHSVDLAAKSLELSAMGVRELIRKALLAMPQVPAEPVPEKESPEPEEPTPGEPSPQ